jgi:hypothetical protein
MMPKTIRITIEVPDGAAVMISSTEDEGESDVANYWSEYLSDNGRALYGAAAKVELSQGPGYTLNAIAEAMSISYESAQSIHRTTGRTAKRWANDSGGEAPIYLISMGYDWSDEHGGMRTTYRLPEGVAEEIATL